MKFNSQPYLKVIEQLLTTNNHEHFDLHFKRSLLAVWQDTPNADSPRTSQLILKWLTHEKESVKGMLRFVNAPEPITFYCGLIMLFGADTSAASILDNLSIEANE